ncbi:hypothetical protein BH683_012335 [Williamsia sp. 1138]|uniref:hypothetical protein n=1 Tax=Williamsia sp. 1138 TaxID=1903117 RepID=UPI000A10DBF8|nr:hypothetical protein [Williamsia sp. 1138]OZG28871.1 hypothetical protein BH683_012335 [Williamsia sp. 1138]
MADNDDSTELNRTASDSADTHGLQAQAELAQARAIEAEAELKLAQARSAALAAAIAAHKTDSAPTTSVQLESTSTTAATKKEESSETTDSIDDDAQTLDAGAALDTDGAQNASDPSDNEVTSTKTRRLLLPLAAVVLVALVVAGIGLSAYFFDKHQQADDTTAKHTAYIQAARQGVLNILSVNFNSADADIKRILDNATGKWQEEFSPQAAPFVDVVKQAKVTTTASISGAGLEKVNPDNSAQVVIAATAKVTNSAGAQEEPRTFRVRVTVAPQGDWLKVSNMEYIAS